MHIWRKTVVAISLVLNMPVVVVSQDLSPYQGRIFCGIDRNSDGDYDGEGEIAECDNGVCPLDAQECLTNRVHQVCEEDTEVTTCGDDTVVEVCEPDTTTIQCDPDTTTEYCDPDTTRRVCDPNRVVRECTPQPPKRVCTPQPDKRVCAPDREVEICENVIEYICPFTGAICSGIPVCFGPGLFSSLPCQPGGTTRVCHTEIVAGECQDIPQPDVCENVPQPDVCVQRTIEGECRDVTVEGECYEQPEPGECREIVVPGECVFETEPGKCVTEVVPGECRDEPLPDECPLAGVGECLIGSDGISRCSDIACVDTSEFPIEELQNPREAYVDDGLRDASGECLNDIQVFTGRAMDCQRPGLITLFKNCCKDRGEVIHDTGGVTTIGFKAVSGGAVVAVFAGAAKAASVFATTGSATAAASAGSAAISAVAGPATVAVGVYLVLTELLGFGCDQQDYETALLAGSGFCHEIGSYCTARIPLIGCIQKARAHCCFNSKLGRIIHQQGRAQLIAFDTDGGWGEPETPECRGFTPAEFQALNFADIDLSEYYDELVTQTAEDMQSNFEAGLEAYTTAGATDGD